MSNFAVHGSYFSINFGDLLLIEIARDLVRSAGLEPVLLNPSNRVKMSLSGSDFHLSSAGRTKDGILFAGGGYLGPVSANSMLWEYRNLMRHGNALKIATREPSYFYGVGFGALPEGAYRQLALSALDNAKFIAFRDIESLTHYRACGGKKGDALVMADAATQISLRESGIFVGEELYCERSAPPSTKKIAVFHVEPGHGELEFQAVCDGVSRAAIAMSDEYEIHFIADGIARWRETKQIATARKLAKSVQNAVVVQFCNCEQLMQLLAEAEVIVTTKLHVGIVGAALGKNVIALPHHSKVERFYSQIGESHRVLTHCEDAATVAGFIEGVVGKNQSISLNYKVKESAALARQQIVALLQES